jgi:LPXTG-motif cell wall-anchored protein
MRITIRKTAGVMLFTTATLLVGLATPASAQEDLNCGDPGVGVSFPVDPNNDPNDFDRDGDGIGCESDEGGAPQTPASTPSAPSHVTELPRTGTATSVLAVIGASLVALGVAALQATQRLRPRHSQ